MRGGGGVTATGRLCREAAAIVVVVVACANASVLALLLLLASVPADLGQGQCVSSRQKRRPPRPPSKGSVCMWGSGGQ